MLKPIKAKEQYDTALARIYELMQTEIIENSSESDELEVLSILVKEYETEHYPIPSPNPLEAIKFRLDQMGLSEKELGEILGYRSRKSEILSGKRKLSLAMIRRLNEVLHIPAEILILDPYFVSGMHTLLSYIANNST
jgi:HTH-type transcriptional regulator/antitoxin HigA